MMLDKLCLVSWLGAVLALAGCAGLPTQYHSSFQEQPVRLPPPELKEAGVPLVVIRWPSGIDPAAKKPLADKYTQHNVLGLEVTKYQGTYCRPAEQTLPETVVKSGYYAAELYSLLARKLPADRLVMQPGVIRQRDDGRFDMAFQGGPVKGVIYVDYVAFVDRCAVLETQAATPSTVASYLVSLMSVHTDPAGSPKTLGALVGIKEMPPLKPDSDHGGARANFWDYAGLSKKQLKKSKLPFSSRQVVKQRPLTFEKYLALPITNISMEVQEDETKSRLDSPKALQPLADLVVDALAAINHDPVVTKLQSEAMQRYDAALATRIQSGTLTPVDHKNIDTLRQIVATETRAQAEFSGSLVKSVLESDYGVAFRKGRAEEWDAEQSATTRAVLMALGGLVLGVVTGGMGAAAIAAAPAQAGAVFATQVSVATTFGAGADAMTRSFYEGLHAGQAGVVDKSYEITTTINNRQLTLRFDSIQKLREALAAIYREEQAARRVARR